MGKPEERNSHQNVKMNKDSICMPELSIIIVSFNTKKVTSRALKLLKKNLTKYPVSYEVIVVDNNSTDGSQELLRRLRKEWPNLSVIYLEKNVGFGKANNIALRKAEGRYVLFLNSDVYVEDLDFSDLISLMEYDKKIGAITVKLLLPYGRIDPASHRGFPTIWRSFCYFFGLEKIFANVPLMNKIFGGYHLTYFDKSLIHEVEAISGAFFFTRKELMNKIKGFDEDYFAYGEDLEMAWQIKKLGFKILYYPLWSVIHLKSMSGLKKDDSLKDQTRAYFYKAMEIFYRKHYAEKQSYLINRLVYFAINLKKSKLG